MVRSVCRNASTLAQAAPEVVYPASFLSSFHLNQTKPNQVNPRMGSATNNIDRNINPAKQKQHCIFRKSKHLFFIFRTIKLNHPSRTNNSHSYWVKSRLISGTFKDFYIFPSESAKLENLAHLNHIEMKIKVTSYKMTVKYSPYQTWLHFKTRYWWKKTRKVIQVWIEKKYLYVEAYKIFLMYLQPVSCTIPDLCITFCLFSLKVKKINVTLSIYKIVSNYLKIHTNDIFIVSF